MFSLFTLCSSDLVFGVSELIEIQTNNHVKSTPHLSALSLSLSLDVKPTGVDGIMMCWVLFRVLWHEGPGYSVWSGSQIQGVESEMLEEPPASPKPPSAHAPPVH